MKINIVGPVAPFRSGVARHTTSLASELMARSSVELTVISFSRQYPSFLYPGNSDRDSSMVLPCGVSADYCIDALNPLSWYSIARRIGQTQPDLVVIPAWTFFLAPCLGTIARRLRARGIRVTMIVHNAFDHEVARWKVLLTRFQLLQADDFMTHNWSIGKDIEALAPGVSIRISEHPVFYGYPSAQGALVREADLELLFFGVVREYKGLDVALRALARAERQGVRLTVVGEFWEGEEKIRALIEGLGLADRVELVAHYVSDQEAAEYFARCDAVVLPYRSATGSGVAALARWYCRPIIVSNVPGLAEVVRDRETGWIFPAGDEESLANLLAGDVTRGAATQMQKRLTEARDELTWAKFADKLIGSEAVDIR